MWVFGTLSGSEGDADGALGGDGDDQISEGDAFANKEGARREVTIEGFEGSLLALKEESVGLDGLRNRMEGKKKRTHWLVVRDGSREKRVDEADMGIGLRLGVMAPLVDEGCILGGVS